MTCDPLDTSNRCPGGLLCGTDKFCHPDGESSMACSFQLNDANPPLDQAFRDAPPADAAPSDAFTVCPGGAWQADFDSDPTALSAHNWRSSTFDFGKDVTNMAWTPTSAMEQLTTAPAAPFQGVTVFQARVTVQMVDAHKVDLHLNAGSIAESVDVDIAIDRGSSNQRYSVTVTGDAPKTQTGVMSVNPHVIIGKLDYVGHTFELFIDDPGGVPAASFTYAAPAATASTQTFTVTADTNTLVDDLGVCSM